MSAEIQLDLLSDVDVANNDLALTRIRKIMSIDGRKELGVPMVNIRLRPHEDLWMWSVSMESDNGWGCGYYPLPKWGKFAPTRGDAIAKASDEVREKLQRFSPQEQTRVIQWLGEILASH